MPERALLRIGSISAILAIISNILHPTRFSESSVSEAHLQKVAESTLWAGDHIGIFFAVLLIIGGLAALYRSITIQPGATWARLGFAAAVMSGAATLVAMGLDGIGIKEIARLWVNAPAAEKATFLAAAQVVDQIHIGIISLWMTLFFGITFALYGLAVAFGDGYPRWLGWAAVVVGFVAAVVGLIQGYQGPSALVTDVLFGGASILLTLWVLVVGLLMWRKAGTA